MISKSNSIINQIFDSLVSSKFPHFEILADELDVQGPPKPSDAPRFYKMLTRILIPTVLECWPTATGMWTSPAPNPGPRWPLSIRVPLSGSETPSHVLHFDFYAYDKVKVCLVSSPFSCSSEGMTLNPTISSEGMTLNPTIPSDIQGWVYLVHNSLHSPVCPLCQGTGEVPSGMCHCGNFVKDHGWTDGHSPVEMMERCPCKETPKVAG